MVKIVKKEATAVKKTAKAAAPDTKQLTELLQAGAHFGHKTSRWHPKMKPFIFGARGGVHIIDLIQTSARLNEAEKFVEQLTAKGGNVLFVATKRQAKSIVETAAREAQMPYVTYRWLGGMMTNWQTISSRLKHLKQLEAGKADGSWDRLTKKERLDLDNEILKLSKVFDGVRDLEAAPAAVYVVDVKREEIALQEATTLGLPIIAMLDTNANPARIAYPIPANDDAVASIAYITNRIAAAAAKGRAAYESKTIVEDEDAK